GACGGPCCRCGRGGAGRLGGGPLGPLGLAGAPWPGGGPAGLFGAGRPPGCAPSGRGGVLTDIRELFPSIRCSSAKRPMPACYRLTAVGTFLHQTVAV